MTIMNLADCPDKFEEMLHYLKCLSVDKTVVVVCAGQHDVLGGRKRDALRAIRKLATFTGKYHAIIATINLFDESSFERENEHLGYREGVQALNRAWLHEAMPDLNIVVVDNSWMRDELFKPDRLHLIGEGRKLLGRSVAGVIEASALPAQCYS